MSSTRCGPKFQAKQNKKTKVKYYSLNNILHAVMLIVPLYQVLDTINSLAYITQYGILCQKEEIEKLSC